MQLGLYVLMIFWSIPVSAIQVWTNLDNVHTIDPYQTDTESEEGTPNDYAYTFLRNYLPVLALIGLQSVLPIVFRFVSYRYEGYKIMSDVETLVLSRNWQIQLATLYVTVLSGTVSGAASSHHAHENLVAILQSPRQFFRIVREEVPQVACYFTNYVIAKIGMSLPFLVLWPAAYIWRPDWIPGAGVVQTPKSGEGSETSKPTKTPIRPNFATQASDLAQILVLGLTYSIMAPAIMPVCALYFGL